MFFLTIVLKLDFVLESEVTVMALSPDFESLCEIFCLSLHIIYYLFRFLIYKRGSVSSGKRLE